MVPGAKISDYNKALNWDVDHVQVNGEAFSQSELENIEIHEDSVVKVFYQAKNTDYIGEASFYDYEVIPYDTAGQQRADLSINADSNYPSEQKDNRFTVGTVSQNLSENQYDTVTKKTGQNDVEVLVEASGRHVHLSQQDIERLFGKGYKLTPKKNL